MSATQAAPPWRLPPQASSSSPETFPIGATWSPKTAIPEEKRILSHSGGSIEGNQSIQLITDLFRDPAFQQAAQQAGMVVHPAASFRHIAVQSGASITGISLLPPHDHLGEVIGPLLPSGNDNAQVLKSLMKLAHQVLDHHPINEQRRAEGKRPANGVWFWAEGSAVALESFWEKYHKTGTVISAVPLCFGIARLSGLDIREVPGATGELDTNYEGKVAAALEELRSGKDFVAVHVEAPDECTHNGDLPGKLQAIEWLDSRVVGPLTQAWRKRARITGCPFSNHKTSPPPGDMTPTPSLICSMTAGKTRVWAFPTVKNPAKRVLPTPPAPRC
ncbi:MAG: hypothetical protein ACLVGW_00735 [Evtepia gabavorous]